MVHYYSSENPYMHSAIIQGVVFDLDNTLYAEPENAHEYHLQAAIEAVLLQCSDLDEPRVRDLLIESKDKYGGSLDIFTKEYGADMERLRRDQYARLIKNTTNSTFFDPNSGLRAGVSKLRIAGINIAIATHGNEAWKDHALAESVLGHLFNDRSVHVCKDDMPDFAGKEAGTQMHERALDMLGVPKNKALSERGIGYVLIEDTLQNLKFAKEMGEMTILINADNRYSPEDIEKAGYVDVIVDTHNDATGVIIDSNAALEIQMRMRREADTGLEASSDFPEPL
ncbi:MAG: hypothetical protein COB36_06920 [Alphaproteobacteria bacterium]|nr:MAG: hypothetical protein COB36_06920 [Alphaproteobacteria bacterium]